MFFQRLSLLVPLGSFFQAFEKTLVVGKYDLCAIAVFQLSDLLY